MAKQNARKNLQNRKRRRDNINLKSVILRQVTGVRIHPLNNHIIDNAWDLWMDTLKVLKS
jgi:hypothetical protein